MSATNPDILRVSYCYAQQDEELRNQLTTHLSPLRQARKLTIWLDVEILPGSDWQLEVQRHIQQADLILLLVSPDFMHSDYCYHLQLTSALNQYEAGAVDIIPILLRPVLWEETPIKRLPLILPPSQLPVTLWPDRDEALRSVAVAIRDLIQARLPARSQASESERAVLGQLGAPVLAMYCPQCGERNRVGARFCTRDGVDLHAGRVILRPERQPALHTKEEWVKEGQASVQDRQYAGALAAYEQALLLDPHYALAAFYKGHVLYHLQQYTAALRAYEQAARCAPGAMAPVCQRGHTLRHLRRYPEALDAYEQALQAGSAEIRAVACNGRGRVLSDLKRYTEALVAYEQAMALDARSAEPLVGRGIVFHERKQYTEALKSYERASLLDPRYPAPYFYKGNVLFDLERYREALDAYERALTLDAYYAAAYHGQGRVYEKLGLVEEAQEALRKAAAMRVEA